MRKIKKVFISTALALAVTALGGCALFGSPQSLKPTLINGTTAGNIQNFGFAVKQDEIIFLYYTNGDLYQTGDIVKSNPETGENSLAMHDGGLYMSVYDANLYYCKVDGIYRASMDTFESERLLEVDATQLQISDGKMFYIEDGVINSADANGDAVDFIPIAGAECLNVYENKLLYIDSATGQIWQANTDSSDQKMLFDIDAKQFLILEGVFYYMDNADNNIKRIAEKDAASEIVVPYACSGFNINAYGLYYTREADGKWVCCNADISGKNEQIIAENGESKRHLVCMFDGSAAILGEEEFRIATE